MNNKCCKRHQQ